MLSAALSSRRGLDESASAGEGERLAPRERAFARALVMVALRRLGPIDRVLDGRLKSEPPTSVRDLLRLGLAQAFYLDTPVFAAVDTTVALAPERYRGLVNAILRGQLRDGPPPDDSESLAPPWLFARWAAAYGRATALEMAARIAEEPATDLTVRTPADLVLAEALEADILPGGSLRTRRRGDIASWEGYDAGRWWVQDAAAAVPARLLRVAPQGSALDLCAAPGGKTFQLAAGGARVTALDRSAPRLKRVISGLSRLGLKAETQVADGAAWPDKREFDAVLLDAPCSATGAFRRHPDVLWNVRPGDIAPLVEAQMALLSSAAQRVRRGGSLVYSVCSLESEEGEDRARAFLSARGDFTLDRIEAGEGGSPPASRRPEGWLRILPHHLDGGVDGFFIARFTRV
jgi:16S rRNA (cytosine967-C5)-methyltransferase